MPCCKCSNSLTAPLNKKNKDLRPNIAKILEVYITKLLFEMPMTAGIESNAKTKSIAANNTTTTNKLVYTGFPFCLITNFPSPATAST